MNRSGAARDLGSTRPLLRRSPGRGSLRAAAWLTLALASGAGTLATEASPEGEPDAAPQSYASSTLLPFEPRRARFRLSHPDETSRELAWSRLEAEGGQGRWRIEAPGHRAALLERDAAGAVRVIEHLDYERRQRITYDPPALLLPARLEVGAETRSESDVTVYDTEDGSQRATGTCRHRVSLVGTRRVDTPAGEFEGVQVDVVRVVDVPIAEARVTVELTFLPGRGRVKQRVVEKLSWLGIGTEREKSVLELVAEGDGADDAAP